MSTYLMTQLVEARHNDLVDEAHVSRQLRAARSAARRSRRSRRNLAVT